MAVGEWTISYNAGKVKYSIELTDVALARHDPAILLALVKLVRRAETQELRDLAS